MVKKYECRNTGNLIALSILLLGYLNVLGSNVDSLLQLLEKAENRSTIYNHLSEVLIEDSLELSLSYAKKAMAASLDENDINQEGIAWFNIGEVYSNKYIIDSAEFCYKKALPIFIKTSNDYYTSYTYNNLGWIYNSYGEYEKAIEQYEKSIPLIDTSKYADDLSHLLINIGNAYRNLGKFYTGIEYFRKATEISKKLNDFYALPIAYSGIGLAYKHLGNYDSALYYYKSMLEIDKEYAGPDDLAVDYGNIGSLFFVWKDYHQAYKYMHHAFQLQLASNLKNGISTSANNLGQIHAELDNYDSAFYYFNLAIDIDKQTGKTNKLAKTYNSLGDLYKKLNDWIRAEEKYKQALAINLKLNADFELAVNHLNLAKLYKVAGDFDNAEKQLETSRAIGVKINSGALLVDITKVFSDLYVKKGDHKKATQYLKSYVLLKDSIFNSKNQQTLADLKSRYDLDRKQQKIELLSQKNQLQQDKVRLYQNSIIGLIIGILSIGLLLVFLIIQRKRTALAYNKLVIQSKKIEGLKKEKAIKTRRNGNGFDLLDTKLQDLMANNKPFLDDEINLSKLAGMLETNSHYLSEVINQKHGLNFSTWLNEYRVNEAIKLISDPDKSHLTMEAIAYESGFKSKSTFNIAFKNQLGVTPSYYKKTIS